MPPRVATCASATVAAAAVAAATVSMRTFVASAAGSCPSTYVDALAAFIPFSFCAPRFQSTGTLS